MMRLFVIAALLIALIPGSLATGLPSPVCFSRTQQCCYKYSACGSVTRRVSVSSPCTFTKCSNVCKDECNDVPTKVSKNVCVDKKVVVGKICGNGKDYGSFGHSWKQACKPKFAIKRVCGNKIVEVIKNVCKKVCKNECRTVNGICIKINTVQFPKFCANLSCDTTGSNGNGSRPADIVGKKGKIVKTEDGGREENGGGGNGGGRNGGRKKNGGRGGKYGKH